MLKQACYLDDTTEFKALGFRGSRNNKRNIYEILPTTQPFAFVNQKTTPKQYIKEKENKTKHKKNFLKCLLLLLEYITKVANLIDKLLDFF